MVGKIVNGFSTLPFALPILHGDDGRLVIDAVLIGEEDLLLLFSAARAYFMVDMSVPSATVQFLRALMPRKTRSELYAQVGLQKQGKALFYRDLLTHLRHSSDKFRIAPGIKGMVMLVFDLPSFPVVFKVIKDFFPPQKETTREQVMDKYLLVKHHDRVGRMADTLEFSNVALPRNRFEDDLIAELKHFCGSLLEDDGHTLVIRHAYIERRMVPLNIYLQEASPVQMSQAVIEYGNAIKDLVAANIFPGDMLWKNFGVTRHGKVVFYDYDEIEYLTDCNFRRVPAPRNDEEEMSGEIWYDVKPRDVFPRDVRALPARQPRRAPGVHGRTCRPAGRRVLAAAEGPHPRRLRARRVPVRPGAALQRTARRFSFCFHEKPARDAGQVARVPFFHPLKEPPMSDSIVIVSAARTPIGGMLGDFAGLAAWELGAVAVKAAVERAGVPGRRRRRGADRQLPDGRPGPGARAPGRAPRGPARLCGRRHAQQDVRLRHARHDVRARHAAGRLGERDGGRRHGKHDQRAAPDVRGARACATAPRRCSTTWPWTAWKTPTTAAARWACSLNRAWPSTASRARRRTSSRSRRPRAPRPPTRTARSTGRSRPSGCKGKGGETIVKFDEQPFKAKLDKIPTLKPAFKKDGTITAANASSISDGAAALVLMRESDAAKFGAKPIARVVAHAVHAQAPEWFSTAPAGAIQKVLKKTGWSAQSVDLWEVNEAFAAVTMAAMTEFDLSHDIVNVHGGACALGHPIGASGARIVVTLLGALRKQGKKRGVAALCIGGGEATALAVEML